MTSTLSSVRPRAQGLPLVFTWVIATGSLIVSVIPAAQMWIVKVHGASADLGFAFFAAAALFYGVYVFGAVVLTYAAWYQVPGPWRALRIVTWSVTVPVAVGLVAFCYATASGWRFPDGPGGHELAWASAPAWLILVVVVMFGYALLLHVITRLPAHRRLQTLILGALAFLAVTGVIVMPFLV